MACQTSDIPDERLALMFACAHPAIEPGVRAPLILQTILGFDAEAIVSYLFAVGDGFALQALSDPERDNAPALAAGAASARYLLVAE